MRHWIAVCVLFGLNPAAVLAQPCSEVIPNAVADSRYHLESKGTVLDRQTGLIWKRCAEGYDLVGESCRPIAGAKTQFNWSEALQQPHQVNSGGGFGGERDWRLPNRNELDSLVDLHCSAPTINSRIFPDTPPTWFWSSTPNRYSQEGAMSLSFKSGHLNTNDRRSLFALRLVRQPVKPAQH